MPKMTQYERLSIILAGLAIILAIASPFVSYHWFDPQLQAFRHRARLQVAVKSVSVEDTSANTPTIRFDITNIGDLPGKDIRIVAQYPPGSTPEEPQAPRQISFAPLATYDMVSKGELDFIVITRPLAPQDTIEVSFQTLPINVSVSSEFGESQNFTLSDLKALQRVGSEELEEIKKAKKKSRK